MIKRSRSVLGTLTCNTSYVTENSEKIKTVRMGANNEGKEGHNNRSTRSRTVQVSNQQSEALMRTRAGSARNMTDKLANQRMDVECTSKKRKQTDDTGRSATFQKVNTLSKGKKQTISGQTSDKPPFTKKKVEINNINSKGRKQSSSNIKLPATKQDALNSTHMVTRGRERKNQEATNKSSPNTIKVEVDGKCKIGKEKKQDISNIKLLPTKKDALSNTNMVTRGRERKKQEDPKTSSLKAKKVKEVVTHLISKEKEQVTSNTKSVKAKKVKEVVTHLISNKSSPKTKNTLKDTQLVEENGREKILEDSKAKSDMIPTKGSRQDLTPCSTNNEEYDDVQVECGMASTEVNISRDQYDNDKLMGESRGLLPGTPLLNHHRLMPPSPTTPNSRNIVSRECQRLSPLIPTISVNTPDRDLLFNGNIHVIADSRIRTLGKGSFGTVIQATYKGQLVAVKVVTNSRLKSLENELNNFLLSHKNIVSTLRICCSDEVEACGLIIMEMCSSINLDHLTHDQSFQMDDSIMLRFAKDIGEALSHCHSQRIVHLDVKPRNILVNLSDNSCKLCDYGSSCLFTQEPLVKGTPTQLQGTIIYTAPELLIGEHPTDKADVYSFGITLWQIIYRDNPYKIASGDLQSTIYKIVKEKHRPPINEEASLGILDCLCVKCWHEDAKQRPSMQWALNEIAQHMPQNNNSA